MNKAERAALAALKFDVAPVPDDVWRGSPFHVDSLHPDVLTQILDGLSRARVGADSNPLGIVVQGIAGSGKTHLLGWVRERAQASNGYFFLISLLDGAHFWQSATLAFLEGLQRNYLGNGSQLATFLGRLCEKTGASAAVTAAVTGDAMLTPKLLDEFVKALRAWDGTVGLACHNTARALVLLGSHDMGMQDVGYSYLQSISEMQDGERRGWGIHPEPKLPHQIAQEISQLLALTGPSLIAIDQLDTLIAQAATATGGNAALSESGEQTALINEIADGLMSLRQSTRHSLTVVACLPSTWTLLSSISAKSFADRFHRPTMLESIPDADVARQIVEKRFTLRFEQIEFKPPYPTWPIRPQAFDGVPELTPRRLINRVNDHIQQCLNDGKITELTDWAAKLTDDEHPLPEATANPSLDSRFEQLKQLASATAATTPESEDAEMSALLAAGLTAWMEELGPHRHAFKLDPPMGGKSPLHARLRHILDESREDEQHWSFRGISHTHPISILARLQAARTSAGLSKGITKRKLILLRNIEWHHGPKSRIAIADFTSAGGATLPINAEDLKTFAALRQMLAERAPGLESWLRANRPAGKTALLRSVLGEVAASLASRATEPEVVQGSLFEPRSSEPGGQHLILGRGIEDGHPLRIELASLRKHTAIFAGSGSGKTVLIRRLVEECALQGVSAIVLDPNNDLARLGDAWPEPPDAWDVGDAARAKEYLEHTDVVVWTPRRESGRPLTFQPLPDLHSILNDVDELGVAVDAAVASLAPRAKVDGATAKAQRGKAVLKETLLSFARQRREGIRPFVELLNTLPEGVSQLEDAEKIAFEMAQNLKAAMVNDPMFGGSGVAADPGTLLTPADGKRARVSVISFVGLPSEQQRQSFVNQLQMALFAWIKSNPAGDRPLGGLLVMDEAQTLAPSGPMTACTASTLALASQARKYGLGLVFATQAPKGLHNRISGNAATQFFGLLNAPVQIEAAREMARAKGGDVPDVGRLGSGQFYASGEGFELRKVQMPLCLSHHPASPLTTEEVLERARQPGG